MAQAIEKVQNPTLVIDVRGREFTVKAMSGEEALVWAETQVICAREKVAAYQLAMEGRESDLRAVLEQLMHADVFLVAFALGCEASFVTQMSYKEKERVLAIQDELNRLENIVPFLAIQNQTLSVWTR